MDAIVQQVIGGNRPGTAFKGGFAAAADASEFGDIGRGLALTRAVALDILPRLVLPPRTVSDRWSAMGPAGIPSPLVVSATLVETFAGLVLDSDLPRAFALAESARTRGMSLESLYLDLLAPAARHLGDLWTEDLCDFTQVTIGLCGLHRVMREMSPVLRAGAIAASDLRRALLIPAPGEQHTFGLAMVTEFFRQAAWTVWSGVPARGGELAGIVHDNWFGVVGFSVGSEQRLDALRTGIQNVRRASQNPGIAIIVGGPIFNEHPDWVAQVGADGTATDGRQAVTQAQGLLTRLSDRA